MVNEIKFFFIVIYEYIKLYIKQFVKNKKLMILNGISSISFQILNIILILSIYKYNDVVNGWKQFELLFLFSYVGLIVELSSFITAGIYKLPRIYLHEGEWDMLLIYPYSTLMHLILKSLPISRILNVFTSLALMIVSSIILGIDINILKITILLVSIFSGIIMIAAFTITLGATAFKLNSRYSLGAVINFTLPFAKYPITFFNSVIQMILTYVIPIKLFIGDPVKCFIGDYSNFKTIFLLPIASIVMIFVSVILFNYMARFYVTSGSN